MAKINYILILVISLSLIGCGSKTEPISIDMKAIAFIESSYNPLNYNRHSKAVGLYQITPICLKDYNKINKTNHRYIELFNPIFNYEVAYWYFNKRIPQLLKAYNLELNINNILICYVAGVKKLKDNQISLQAEDYIVKYNNFTKGD